MGEVDQLRPWLGLDSFSETTRGFFYGRDEEVAELARRVRRKLLSVLFGQSGLGKTSILRAGIVPRLREEGYCPVYVRIDYGPAAPPPAHQVRMAIEAAAHYEGGTFASGESLWALLHLRSGAFADGAGQAVMPLLIFDQFEEIFTLGQAGGAARMRAAQFIEELACLVENRPPRELEDRMDSDDSLVERYDFSRDDYRVLLSLREDYLAHLEELKGAMPSITQNRMRLAPMSGEQALQAVRIPGGALVGGEVAEAIVGFVAGSADLGNAQIEPSLLSLICRELNEARIAADRSEISLDLLAGSHASILSDFYERAMAPHPPAVRAIVEDVLLTDSGYRENVAQERIEQLLAQAGADPDTLPDLVNRRLLRIEERLALRRVELTHDVLCPVVRASRDLRKEREARQENERRLAEQHERELATRKSLVRTRQIAIGSAALAVAAIVAFGFAWKASNDAASAERIAEAARHKAAVARAQAERLIGYLNHDFADQLKSLTRQDLIEALNKRTVEYYQSLPAIAPGSDTERNRAISMVRYGLALRYTSRLAEAKNYLSQAVATLEARRARGDSSEATAVALAEAYLGQRRLAFAYGQDASGLEKSTAALETLKPWARKTGAPFEVRLLYAEILQSLAFIERKGDRTAAVTHFDEADAIYQSLYRPGADNTNVVAGMALSAAGSLFLRFAAGRTDIDAYADTVDTFLRREIDRDPANLPLRFGWAGLSEQRGEIASEKHDLLGAIRHLTDARARFRDLVRVDPFNQNYLSNLMTAANGLGWMYENSGDSANAFRTWADGIEVGGKSAALASRKAELLTATAQLQGQLGLPSALPNLDEAQATLHAFQTKYPGQADGKPETNCDVGIVRARLATIRGDLAGAMRVLESLHHQDGPKDRDAYTRYCRDAIDTQAAETHIAAGRNQAAIDLLSRFVAPPSHDYLGEGDARRAGVVLLALAHSNAGNHAKASSLIGPMLAEQRRDVALRGGNRMLEVQLAAMLLLQARSSPDGAREKLVEARALLERLPVAMKPRYDVRRWRAIVDASLNKLTGV